MIACARVKVRDTEWCADAGALGASCVHTLSDETRDVGPYEWEQERFGKLCASSEDFTSLLTSALQACKVCKCCTFEVKKKMKALKARIDGLKLNEKGLYVDPTEEVELHIFDELRSVENDTL